jgi:sec-independent protein translocase protein TatA
MPSLGGWEFVILIGILVLLFGAKRLPDMARSIGQSARVFKGEMKGMKEDEARKAAAQDSKPVDPSAGAGGGAGTAPAPPAALPPAAETPQNGQGPTKAVQPGHSNNAQ